MRIQDQIAALVAKAAAAQEAGGGRWAVYETYNARMHRNPMLPAVSGQHRTPKHLRALDGPWHLCMWNEYRRQWIEHTSYLERKDPGRIIGEARLISGVGNRHSSRSKVRVFDGGWRVIWEG